MERIEDLIEGFFATQYLETVKEFLLFHNHGITKLVIFKCRLATYISFFLENYPIMHRSVIHRVHLTERANYESL